MKSKNIFIALIIIFLLGCSHKLLPLTEQPFSTAFDISYDPNRDESYVSKEWLKNKVPLKEMDSKFKESIIWIRLRNLLFEGDEIWYFDSPRETWHKFAGRRGYAIVRDGKTIGGFFTALN